MHSPDQRPQLLAILVCIVAELLLELADDGNRVLESIVGGIERARVGGFSGRHFGGGRWRAWRWMASDTLPDALAPGADRPQLGDTQSRVRLLILSSRPT